ncbi:MAG: hypothetical protein D8M59_02820 [Planctomycetes bacterium]|nr:hypothetical protein [Planctomycetota bacterium]NOG52928.1 hypothetical protein [Planctomycetota bacterium]
MLPYSRGGRSVWCSGRFAGS